MRSMRVPRLLVAVIGLMWRYLFVMADEAQRMVTAREARSGHSGELGARAGGGLAWRARVTGGMAGSLFVRSFERGDRIYSAMAARGYDGEVRSLPVPGIPAAQWVVLATGVALLGLLLSLSYLLLI
jgi:cobalt/nickel transport system permease protein